VTSFLEGTVLVVTGGTRGIGRAIVLEAVRQGARVAFCAREVGPIALEVEAAAAAIAGPGRTLAVRADVACESDVAALFDATLMRFGCVDAAINNAATSTSSLLVTHSTAEWDRVTATNLTGPFFVSRQLVRTLRSAGRPGALVSIGSVAQNGARANASYSASKGALLGLTRGLASECGAQGIRANLVVAGWVETELAGALPDRTRRLWRDVCPLQRPATPGEVARVALFLASDRSRPLNGQALYATAGVRQLPV
jgi:NAD(P)-dependent dehydrogenase (short-subunit alcohol dehydrogenase family)